MNSALEFNASAALSCPACRMMPIRNTASSSRVAPRIPSKRMATVMIWVAFAAFWPVVMYAQPTGQSIPADVVTVNPVTALQAHTLAERWVRDTQVPTQAGLPRPVQDLLGIEVTIRLHGQVLGRGQAVRTNLDDASGQTAAPIDLVPLLQSATADALIRARQMWEDPATVQSR